MSSTITRITTLKTLERYNKQLIPLVQKYLQKSKCVDTLEEILDDIKTNCHNPYFTFCVIETGSTLTGFVVVVVQPTASGKKAVVEHFHCPNNIAATVYKTVIKKLRDRFGITETIFVTYRDPGAWIRLARRHGLRFTLTSYLLSERSE